MSSIINVLTLNRKITFFSGNREPRFLVGTPNLTKQMDNTRLNVNNIQAKKS